jgi:NAD(P)-dependent dehydrogenase (short-subunit alcohol dehydrogenase family)
MTSTSNKVYLVTGANIGLGLEATKQLALKDQTKKVYLACRTESKALAAIEDLVREYKIPSEKLAFFPFNASADKATIAKSAFDALPSGKQFDGLILNAGGPGHDKTGVPQGPNYVSDIFQINLIGHIHLLDALKSNGFLKPTKGGTVIVYSGSEAARGLASMGVPAPTMPETPKDYKSIMDGSAFKKYDSMSVYGYVKGMAALYWSAWARKHPEHVVFTVSPGASSGTNAVAQDGISPVMKFMFPIMMKIFSIFGGAHTASVGAKRYVDAVNREGEFEKTESGAFWASLHGASGRVGDQTKLQKGAQYGDVSKQEAAYQAIQAYA